MVVWCDYADGCEIWISIDFCGLWMWSIFCVADFSLRSIVAWCDDKTKPIVGQLHHQQWSDAQKAYSISNINEVRYDFNSSRLRQIEGRIATKQSAVQYLANIKMILGVFRSGTTTLSFIPSTPPNTHFLMNSAIRINQREGQISRNAANFNNSATVEMQILRRLKYYHHQ